jgi:hypothetical protein
MSPRKVVVILYAVSAVFALLSLFLLWPSGNTLGLVLLVIGTGIWFGVQHLGYLEFWEIRRVAQRTIEQRGIFVNDLAIRRAIEELKSSGDYAHICDILKSAFSNNDFDGFVLSVKSLSDEPFSANDAWLFDKVDGNRRFEWEKPLASNFRNQQGVWNLTLELVTTANQWLGAIKIYRFYDDRPLLVDTNLLTSGFPMVLADALGRALDAEERIIPEGVTGTQFLEAEAS